MYRVFVQRKPAPKGDAPGTGVLQRRGHGQKQPATAPPIVHDVLRSSGHPLDTATRAFMEPRFGHDFGKVRVHTDARAAEAAASINALAFASGHRIAFSAGEYSPQTQAGRRLVAHELAHVVQQRSGVRLKDGGGKASDVHEANAEAVAERVVQGGSSRRLLEIYSLAAAEPAGTNRNTEALQRKSVDAEDRHAEVELSLTRSPPLASNGPALDDTEKKILKKLADKAYASDVLAEMMQIEQEMAAKQADFNSKKIDDIVHEIEMRYFVVQIMHFVDENSKGQGQRFGFPDSNRGYMISDYYWKPTENVGSSTPREGGYERNVFSPKDALGSSAAAAMEYIFTSKSRKLGVARLQCDDGRDAI